MKITKKCDVCGNDVLLKKWGDKQCKHCKWIQDDDSLNNPNKLIYPNVTSLNNARESYRKGLKIKPTFNDFIESVNLNLEPNFKYKRKQYGSTNFGSYEFFEWNKKDGYQSYKTIEDFAKNVNINGKLLKDIWEDVYQFELGC